MASRALTKEIRGLVTQKTTAVRKRLAEASTVERLTAAGVAPIGAGVAGLCDGLAVRIPLPGGRSMPIAPLGAAAGIGIGLAMGKGAMAAAVFGAGMGQLDGWIALLVRDLVQENADDDDDDAEA